MECQICFFLFACLSVLADSADLKFSYVLSSSAVDPVYGVGLESTVPAVDLALDYINNNSTLLPGYKLGYSTILRSKCGERPALDTFFHDVLSGNNLGVVGCACSQSTQAMAGVINYWNMPQIACNPVHTEASDDTRYKHLFRLHPQPADYAAAVATVVEHFGWRRMAILSQDGVFYGEVETVLKELLEQGNISVIEPPCAEEDTLFPQDVRVFFLNANISHAKYILCKAHAMKKLFPKYVWLTYSDELNALFSHNGSIQCDEGALAEAAQGLLTLGSVPSDARSAEMLASAYTSASVPYTPLADFAYDSVLTLAALLNGTLEILENGNVQDTGCQNQNGTLVHLENFSYDNDCMGCVLLSVLRNLSIDGITGTISFNSLDERENISLGLHQYRSPKEPGIPTSIFVADIKITDNTIHFAEGENDSKIFRGPIPHDGTPIKLIHAQPLPLIVLYYIIALLGIVFTVVCFLFNIIYRKRKIVKLTSPNLNYFIVAGALCLFGSIYIRVYFDSSRLYNGIRCNLQAIMNCVGYVLVMAPVLAKMWRIYYIFHNPLAKKKGLKDWHLSLIVLAMVAVILVMVILSATVPILRPDLALRVDKERPNGLTDDGIRIEFCAWKCYDSILPFFWVAMEYVYLFLLQAVAVVLAFKTRKVKIKELNDSKSVACIIYVTTIVMSVLMIITFASDGYIIVTEALFSGGIMLATAVFLGLTFIPKMIALFRDPQGEGVMKSSVVITASSAFSTSTVITASTDESDHKLYQLLEAGKRKSAILGNESISKVGAILSADEKD